MTSKDTGHQQRFGRGFIQRVGELFSATDYYTDSSALVKRYMPKIGSEWFQALVGQVSWHRTPSPPHA